MSKDYHDYVIKNGELIGDFENMYKFSESIPWHQNEQDNWKDVLLSLCILRSYSPFKNIYDIGCGLGYFANILYKNLGYEETSVTGYDVSTTACNKAKIMFPKFNFYTLDIAKNIKKELKLEEGIVSLRGVLWYIFPYIDTVVENIYSIMKEDSILFLSQNFPPLDSNFVGKNVIDSPGALSNIFSKKFKIIEEISYFNKKSKDNDNWYLGIYTKER